MTKLTEDTLRVIERLLVHERAGVREALEAAYRLGWLDGMLEYAKRTEAKGK
jgi:hypothetical protein